VNVRQRGECRPNAALKKRGFSRCQHESFVDLTWRLHLVELRFIANFSGLFKGWAKSHRHKPGPWTGGSAQQDKRVVVMARMEMSAIPASLVIPTEASAEAYYELGPDVCRRPQQPVDLVAAQKWFNVALARGCSRAAAHRQELALEMTRDEIAEALREARSFLTRH
jgi:hypothetical protein